MILVVNKRKYSGSSIYIGRPSPLGNPYVIGEHGTRDEVIAKYEVWLRKEYLTNSYVIAAVNKLIALNAAGGDVALCCWCAPAKCHGDVIKKFVEELS